MNTKQNLETMTNPLISIIIPVFNAENYLKKTIGSILNQTYQHLEILLIDDGSTDSSGNICDEIAKQDNRVIIIHQENKGISTTRNRGLDIAKGEYIAFCDNDDIIHPQMIEILYHAILKNHTNLAMCQTATTNIPTILQLYNNEIPSKIVTNEYLLTELYNCSSPSMHLNTNCIWNKLYHKDLIGEIRFTDKGYEDTFFCSMIYCKIKSCAFIELPLYFWLIRSSSQSHHSAFSEYKYLALYSYLKNYHNLQKHQISEQIQAFCLLRLYKTLLAGRYYSSNTIYKDKTTRICKYINKQVGSRFFFSQYIPMKTRAAIFLFFYNKWIYSLFLKFAAKFTNRKKLNPNE